jgi:proton-dependent oligopeptide transporter, POT family
VAAPFLQTVRTGFTRSFWVANTLELFERFAYYASKAVLAVYLAEHLGLGPTTATLYAGSIFNTLIYFLPALAGTVVDRYGFRRSLMLCFSIFSLGYLIVGLAGLPVAAGLVATVGVKTWTLVGLIVAAAGGSLIKPSIVGTCARTTTEESRALGYSIYYSMVNVGGMLGPTLAVPIRENLGIAWVLVVASAVSALLCMCTFLFFSEPQRPADMPPAKSFGQVLAGMFQALSDIRFVTFLVIFSGFWLMFWHIFYALPFYVKDVLRYDRFELIESIGPWTIVLCTVPAAALARRMKPIAAMTLGFAIATSGWFVMGASQTLLACMVGVAIFALGEALQAPRYYEYVANLAPREQVGTYMGIAFLPIAIGTFGTGLLAGRLVEWYKDAPQPSHMWYVLGGIGVVTTILMVVYDRFLAPRDRAGAPAA